MNARPWHRLTGFSVVLVMLMIQWTPGVVADPPAHPLSTAGMTLPAPPMAEAREAQPAPLLLPGGSTISGTLSASDTWGPGVITVTGDITIPAGVKIIITPGTTVQMTTTDGLSSGLDSNRIEWIIYGSLLASGPMTFTSQSGTPAGSDWYGLRFLPDSGGSLEHAVIEYGTHGMSINTFNSVNVANTIVRYNRHAPPAGDAWGAGMAIYTGTHFVVNTQIYSNSLRALGSARAMGAGVYLEDSNTWFADSSVYHNLAESQGGDGFGGGLTLWGDGAPTLNHVSVYDNRILASGRAFGGGVDIDNADAVLEADTFVYDNAITATTGNAYGGGVSIGAFERVPTPIIRNSQVTTNTCATQAGYCFGGGIGFADSAQTRAVVSGSLVAANVNEPAASSNRNACGGGIGMASSATADHFDGNVIRDNLAVSYNGGALGGGICLAFQAVVSVTNDLLFNNNASDLLGASGSGGGIFANGADAYLVNNTVVSNTAAWYGGGVYMAGGGMLSNTIVVSNTTGLDGGGVYLGGGSAGYNDVWGNTCTNPGGGADYDNAGGGVRPSTDIYADPLFIGSGEIANRYHLQQGSPAIDASTDTGLVPNQDYDDQVRPLGRHRDMGFDEVQPFTFAKQVNVAKPVVDNDLVYTITVTNPDNIAPLVGGWLTDVLPISTTYASGPACNLSSYGYDSSSRTAWWNGNVPANTTLNCVYTVTVNSGLSDGTAITNTAFFTVGAQGGWSNVVTTVKPRHIYLPIVLRTY